MDAVGDQIVPSSNFYVMQVRSFDYLNDKKLCEKIKGNNRKTISFNFNSHFLNTKKMK